MHEPSPLPAAVRRCLLHGQLGGEEPCPGRDCPFWELAPGSAAGACFVERLDPSVRATPGLAEHLIELRGLLESAHGDEQQRAARDLLARMLPRDEEEVF